MELVHSKSASVHNAAQLISRVKNRNDKNHRNAIEQSNEALNENYV